MFPIVHLIVLCLTLQLQLHHTATAVDSNYYCPSNLFPNAAFVSNLQYLLSNLSTAANRTTTGFSNATAGEGSWSRVYGIFLCRGDVTTATCVSSAAAQLFMSCFRAHYAIIWNQICLIKYSNANFLGKLDDSNITSHDAYSTTNQSVVDGNLTAFNGVLGAAASKVREKAATGGLEKKFATEEGTVNASLTVYVLGQCTPDLSKYDCWRCLEDCIGNLPSCCENKVGGFVFFPSCNLRYETYQFYNSGASVEVAGSPHPNWKTEVLEIEGGVMLTIVLLFGIFVMGCLRRRVYGSWPGVCITLFHALIISSLIPFSFGQMRDIEFTLKLFPMWACFLLFAYGGFDTMTACNLSDNDNASRYQIFSIPLFFWVNYVVFIAEVNIINNTTDAISFVAYNALWMVSVWNITETIGAFQAASKSHGLPQASHLTAKHMRGDFIDSNANINVDSAVSMRGYSYLVAGSEENHILTTTQVWECVDGLLNSRPTTTDEAGSRLKDICLSRAFFNILLMRCAGHSLEESSRLKSRTFFEKGFLSMEDRQKMEKRLFGIVEWELEFLFDFFYTKFYYFSNKRFALKFNRMLGLAIFLWFAIYELARKQFIGPTVISIHKHNVEVGITRGAIILIAIAEAVQLYMNIFSNWTIVKLICLYEKATRTNKSTAVVERAILFIPFVKYDLSSWGRLSSCMLFKPWRRKLGQYSLIENYDKVPMLKRVIPPLYYKLIFNDPMVIQIESPAVPLSSEVKGAIMSLLTDHGFALSGGKASLARNGLEDQLSSFCNTNSLKGDAHVILVWHIATSICEHHSSTRSLLPRPSDAHVVATQLSKYCAYLAVFAPELLSDVPYTTQKIVNDTIEYARIKLKDTEHIAGRCSKLVSDQRELSRMDEHDGSLFGRAMLLAKYLRSLIQEDPNRGWRVIAEFWVELLLYLAPTENAIAHAERLGTGGEFITVLWAMLTHAGITSRAHFPTTAV